MSNEEITNTNFDLNNIYKHVVYNLDSIRHHYGDFHALKFLKNEMSVIFDR